MATRAELSDELWKYLERATDGSDYAKEAVTAATVDILAMISTPDALRALCQPDHVLVHVPPGWGWRGLGCGGVELCDADAVTRGELVKVGDDADTKARTLALIEDMERW